MGFVNQFLPNFIKLFFMSEYWFCLINNNQDGPQNGYPFSLQGIMCAPCQSLAVLVPTASNSFDLLFVYCYSQCRSLNCSMFCCMLLYVHSSIAIILMGKRELVALLNLSSWCLVMVELFFLEVPWDCLRFVIVVFPDHTHLLFFTRFVSDSPELHQ